MTETAGSVDADEVAKFDALAASWWDADGPSAPLHRMNPVRLDFIRDQLCAQFGRDPRGFRCLDGLKIVDVGCGGGLLAEPMARLGAEVAGVDASEAAVEVARAHAAEQGLDIDYRHATAAELAGETFDAVLALEIVEHVSDLDAFVADAAALVAPGGLLVLTTINRTAKSRVLAIGAAEYLLRWLPRGTHDWSRFPTPEELGAAVERAGLAVVDDAGFSYDLPRDRWSRTEDLSVNYALVGERRAT